MYQGVEAPEVLEVLGVPGVHGVAWVQHWPGSRARWERWQEEARVESWGPPPPGGVAGVEDGGHGHHDQDGPAVVGDDQEVHVGLEVEVLADDDSSENLTILSC